MEKDVLSRQSVFLYPDAGNIVAVLLLCYGLSTSGQIFVTGSHPAHVLCCQRVSEAYRAFKNARPAAERNHWSCYAVFHSKHIIYVLFYFSSPIFEERYGIRKGIEVRCVRRIAKTSGVSKNTVLAD